MNVSSAWSRDDTQRLCRTHRSRIMAAACAAFFASLSVAHSQIPLSTYEDANGNILVRRLTCAQLANTFREDATALALWYSGWYNGRLKRHVVNVHNLREGIHQVVEYCQSHPGDKVTRAIEVFVNGH